MHGHDTLFWGIIQFISMKREKVVNVESAVQCAVDVLSRGGIVLYPTDTLYGLAVAWGDEHALERLYALKGREREKHISWVVADLEMAKAYGIISARADKIAQKFLPGPLTLVVPSTTSPHTFAFRIPKSGFCTALASALGRPYSATSANISGSEPGRDVESILAQFGEWQKDIDCVIDGGVLPSASPSTVLKVEGDEIEVCREGALSLRQILSDDA